MCNLREIQKLANFCHIRGLGVDKDNTSLLSFIVQVDNDIYLTSQIVCLPFGNGLQVDSNILKKITRL